MNEVLEKIQQVGIVPVVVLKDAKDASPLAKALCDGGLSCAEITFRTEAAEESIRIMAKEFPQMILGAGTIVNIEQAKKAIGAGAKFIVSPGFQERIVEYCLEKKVLVFPGCVTPTEVLQAVKYGLEVVKFFPAEPFGGVETIKALAAPYGNMKFMPTGGITTKNLETYLRFPKIVACGGSWMVQKDLIEARDFETIKKLTSEAVELVRRSRS